jgi:threonine dehydratase
MGAWPITIDDVRAAHEVLRSHLAPTPLRAYPALDDAVGSGVRVLAREI